ncbi:O-antigen ligase family protein, partial [bacterium]|nr:O-antigen ligase family protein [bacterium]
LLGTWSRGAWLALLGGGMAGLAVGARLAAPVPWRRRGRAVLVGGAVGGLAVAAALLIHWDAALLPGRRLLQTFSTVDWSNLTRFYSMQAAWRAFLLSPLLGVGWGQFAFHFPALVDPMGLQAMFTWPVVNNFPLAILCETGLLGAGAWAWAGGRLARRVDGAAANAPAAIRTELTLLAAANIALWVQLLTFSQYNLPHIWVGLGLLAGAACRRESAS